ncbi:MAG: hypothetical protein WD795_14335 [Woeseia sp.]
MRRNREAAVEFRGPGAADFDNVRSLNRAFLRLVRCDPEARKCLQGLPPALAARLSSLQDGEVERLASTPFLLLSFRERDDDFWEALFSENPNRDLFTVPSPPNDDLGRLIAAGLGFVWQLARQNPYAARLICGASLHWCEQLTECTIFQILATAGTRSDVLTLRCGAEAGLWTKLLASGISREKQVRRAAHISALQSVLTRASMLDRKKWAAAACAVRTPTLKVADETES